MRSSYDATTLSRMPFLNPMSHTPASSVAANQRISDASIVQSRSDLQILVFPNRPDAGVATS